MFLLILTPGSYHINLDIDDAFNAQKSIFTRATGFEPKFKVHGGSYSENIALQNLQARTRMVIAYEFGQMLPTIRQRKGGGSLLVLGSSNADEAIRGYVSFKSPILNRYLPSQNQHIPLYTDSQTTD